jgi:hypothetical protein
MIRAVLPEAAFSGRPKDASVQPKPAQFKMSPQDDQSIGCKTALASIERDKWVDVDSLDEMTVLPGESSEPDKTRDDGLFIKREAPSIPLDQVRGSSFSDQGQGPFAVNVRRTKSNISKQF